MKKIISSVVLLAFVLVLLGTSLAYADSRSPAQKLTAGNKYLKSLDTKIKLYRKQRNLKMVKTIQLQKKATIKRMKVWKAEAAAARMAPPPPPPPPRRATPPPRRVAPKPVPKKAQPDGLFGLGIRTTIDTGYITGGGKTASLIGGWAMIMDDAMALGPMMGMAEDAVKYKVGLGGTYGKDYSDNSFNAILVTFDGILHLPEEWTGMQSYVGGQVNYPVYKSDPAGAPGGAVYYGIQGDAGIGLDSPSYAEVGYGAARREGYSSKGFFVKVGQHIVL